MLRIFNKLAVLGAATLLAFTNPTQPIATLAASGNVYVSEVKLGSGKTEAEAKKELLEEGYTILTQDGGGYADLNEGAGSDNAFAKGQRIVYLGYKTTMNASEAITDLATMNMRGGYSVKDYEELMSTRLKTEVIPFVERFLVTLDEYRANLTSEYARNKARALYMKSMLNKLTDDDTGGLMGDLLALPTKYELGDDAYAALPEEEKKQHADILTIVMQANGQSTLSMETLLTKATDPAETTWIERLGDNTLDNLRDRLETSGVDVADIDTTLDRMYGDGANKLLEKWDVFYQALIDYDDKANALLNFPESEYDSNIEKMADFDADNKDRNKVGEAVIAQLETRDDITMDTLDLELVAAKGRLDQIDYVSDAGATLGEFFETDASAFNGDGIRDLYPIVASLSAGQLAGLDFLSLQDLVTIGTAEATSYSLDELGDITPTSIYEGVNREIFQKGKVALTTAALREDAMKNDAVVNFSLSATTYVLWGATAVASAGMIASWTLMSQFSKAAAKIKDALNPVRDVISDFNSRTKMFILDHLGQTELNTATKHQYFLEAKDEIAKLVGDKYAGQVCDNGVTKTAENLATKSKICTYLGAAFTVAMAVLAGYTIYSTFKEMIDFYNVEYSPIPKYMVDRAELVKEVDGVETVIRNDTAYYEVAKTNRKPSADCYDVLQNYADLNGDVCAEWLALYFCRYQGKAPILADSLKVVKGTDKAPDGYERGIHMFGKGGAQNLNSRYYCYNDPTKGVYVYFKADDSIVATEASVAGSAFSTGSAFLFAGIGAAAGAGIAVAVTLILKRKKKEA